MRKSKCSLGVCLAAKIIREWREVAAFSARQFFLNACNFPPFAYRKSDIETRPASPLFNPVERNSPREWLEDYGLSAGFEPATFCSSDRCSTYELACNFPPIAWCKSKCPGGRTTRA